MNDSALTFLMKFQQILHADEKVCKSVVWDFSIVEDETASISEVCLGWVNI